jgi:hypothetical protein
MFIRYIFFYSFNTIIIIEFLWSFNGTSAHLWRRQFLLLRWSSKEVPYTIILCWQNECRPNSWYKYIFVLILTKSKLNYLALELSPCEYTITMPSVYGCPLECPVSNRRLCGGNGHCAYDPDKSAARCFCNKGSELKLHGVALIYYYHSLNYQ